MQRELSVLRNRLGDVLEARGQLDAALAEYRRALEVRRTLAAIDPSNAQAQRDLSLSHERVGEVLRKQGRLQEALVELEASLAIARRLAAAEPANRQWQEELAIAERNLARVWRRKADLTRRGPGSARHRRRLRRRLLTKSNGTCGTLLRRRACRNGKAGGRSAAELLSRPRRRTDARQPEPESDEWRNALDRQRRRRRRACAC